MPAEQSWRILLQKDVQEFIQTHERDDVASLALQKMPDASWYAPIILDQIKARQKARLKCKNLYDTPGFIFPASNILEQASSSACAAFKANLVKGRSFADLTAGCGIDAFHIAGNFQEGILVEQDTPTSEILAHNASVLNQKHKLSVECANAVEAINHIPEQDLFFIDPQRRNLTKKGLYKLEDCSPDLFSMLGVLKIKAKNVLLKTSPILDIKKTVENLGMVHQVHVVQWQNECKEVLYEFDPSADPVAYGDVKISCVTLDGAGAVQQKLEFTPSEENKAHAEFSMPKKYIFEPDPAFLKAGCFNRIAEKHDLFKIHPNSHLYTCDEKQFDFPGKCYEILETTSAKAKSLSINRAEIAVRNYPNTPEELRKKLKIKDGSDYRIYATTLINDEKKLIICKK